MPPTTLFAGFDHYYATLAHELSHNAASRIMPHDFCWRPDSPALAMRPFGIIDGIGATH